MNTDIGRLETCVLMLGLVLSLAWSQGCTSFLGIRPPRKTGGGGSAGGMAAAGSTGASGDSDGAGGLPGSGGGGVAAGGAIGTGGLVATGGSGGRIGTGGSAGAGGVAGLDASSGTGGCITVCLEGATLCISGTSLQTCSATINGCGEWIESSCAPGLVCKRYASATCIDPNWAEWQMPNGPSDATPGPKTTYTNNQDGTVTDNVTGLMWQRALAPGADGGVYATFDPAEAAMYCSGLQLGQHADWRVPSRIELISLVDYGAGYPGPSIDQNAFPDTPSDELFLTTTSLQFFGQFFVDFHAGSSFTQPFGLVPFFVRCVR